VGSPANLSAKCLKVALALPPLFPNDKKQSICYSGYRFFLLGHNIKSHSYIPFE
jgi:hypothetical protein